MVSTTFPDLPNELLHHIISYLHPYHQFDVALSCRTFYHVVRPSFQTHKVNYAEYGRIHLYGGGGDNGEWYEPGDGPEQPCAITPYSLLDRLLKKPDRIKYVAELRIQKNATDMLEGATSAYPLPDVFFRIKASVLENDFLGDWKEGPPGSLVGSLTESEKREAKLLWILADMYDERRLIPALDRGCAGVALGHLLCLCRELRQLKFAPYREQEWVAQALHRIGRAYEEMRDKAGKSRLRDPVRLGLPLENLRRVELRHWDTNGYVNFIWVRLFVELPNLREFRGHMIGLTETNYTGERRCGAGDIGAREECHEGSSNVEELTFSSSAVEPGDWLLLLGSIAALEKFEYECGGVIVERVDWDAHQVIHALEHSAKRTLKCLRLWDGETMEDNNLVSHRKRSPAQVFRLIGANTGRYLIYNGLPRSRISKYLRRYAAIGGILY